MDVCAANWNENDNSNTTAAPDGAPEGMAPSGVNDVLRAHQGAMKRFYNWTIPKITAGSGTAYTLGYAVAPSALVDGMTHLMQFHAVNGANATLNVNGLGALPIHYHAAAAWRLAPPGLIDTDEIRRVAYHASSGTYRLLDLRNRTGEVVPFAGVAVPAGGLFCHGQAVSRTTYAGLFAVLGTSHGAGDGSTTFNLPDLRGRVAAGKDDMGGNSANRLTSPINGDNLGEAGGSQSNISSTTSSVTGSTAGSLTVTKGGPFADAAGNTGTNILFEASTLTTSGSLSVGGTASGTSSAFSVVQPTIILNYLIRI